MVNDVESQIKSAVEYRVKLARIKDALRVIAENSYPVFANEGIFVGNGLIVQNKNISLTRDSKLIESINKSLNKLDNEQDRLTAQSIVWRTYNLAWAAKHCLNIEGDFVELGVYKGYSSFVLANYLNFSELKINWFLYDTFEGVPEDQQNQTGRQSSYEEKYQRTGLYESVVEKFKPFKNIKVIKGKVPDIFERVCPEKIAFLHIDMNSAKAEVGALERLFDRVSPGGIIIFDDYGWIFYGENKVAEDKFMEERGYSIMEMPTGQGFVLKRSDTPSVSKTEIPLESGSDHIIL